MIGTLDWQIHAASTTLNVTGGAINIDDQNVPAITATVTVPFDAGVLAAIDPRTADVPRVTLNGTLTDLAATEPQTMSLNLHVRDVSHDDWEMVISLATDEALLTDWAVTGNADTTAYIEAGQGLSSDYASTYVDMTLQVVLGITTAPNAYTTTRLSDDYEFSILDLAKGSSGWEMVSGALDDANLKLRVNRNGQGFTLQRPENQLPGKGWFSLFTAEDVISARHVITRSGDWYDSAMLHLDGVPAAGYPNSPHTRTHQRNLSAGASKPTVAMARNMVTRASNRGQLIDIVAPIRLGVFMRDEFTYAPTVGSPQLWQVKSVSYDFISATMRIRGELRSGA